MAASESAVRRICPPPSPALPSSTITMSWGIPRSVLYRARPLNHHGRTLPGLPYPPMPSALLVFALPYLAVAAGRVPFLSLDRPAAALLGAVLMVAVGVLTPGEAGAAV